MTFPLVTLLVFRTYYSPPFSIMTTRRCTSPPPLASSTRRRRRSIHNNDPDDDLSTICDNFNDHHDDNSKSHDKPLRRPSRQAMGKRPLKDSFTSTLGKRVVATQSTPMWAQPIHPEHWEVYNVPEEKNDLEPVPLVSKKVSHSAFEWLNPPTNLYIYKMKDSNEAGE